MFQFVPAIMYQSYDWSCKAHSSGNSLADMNHVIHSCTHANVTPGVTLTEEQMFASMEVGQFEAENLCSEETEWFPVPLGSFVMFQTE